MSGIPMLDWIGGYLHGRVLSLTSGKVRVRSRRIADIQGCVAKVRSGSLRTLPQSLSRCCSMGKFAGGEVGES